MESNTKTTAEKTPSTTPNAAPKTAAPTLAPMSNTGALELVVLRNNFYRDNFRRIVIICLALIVLCGALIAWGIYERTNKPAPEYFATTFDGKLIPLTPLNEPSLSDNALIQWATEAAISAYTFNFINFRQVLQDIRIYFTQTGYQNYIKALKDSNNLDSIQTKKLLASAVPTGAPVILRKGIYNDGSPSGVYSWEVQLSMQLLYQNSTEKFSQNIVLVMLITRVSTLDSPDGVGIASFVIQEKR